MNTLKKEVQISSVGLMTGIESIAKIVPSNEKGIRFHIGENCIEATTDNLVSTEHCVVVGNEHIKVMLIEHFMAACSICNIDAIDVYLSHYELPILDGSSKQWVELFNSAGIEAGNPTRYNITEQVQYLNGKTHMVIIPSDKLSITYSVNFNHPELNHRWVALNLDNIEEITDARTFGYLKELEMLQKAGYGRGASIENTVGLTDDGYTTELRSQFEPVKHKILDVLGDLRLTGFNPLRFNAEIIIKEAGHTVHANVAKMLKNKIIEEK